MIDRNYWIRESCAWGASKVPELVRAEMSLLNLTLRMQKSAFKASPDTAQGCANEVMDVTSTTHSGPV
jgi:hypothetical protein